MVSLFAYELDPAGAPVPAPGMQAHVSEFFQLSGKDGFTPWVTVVNDVRQGSETASLKDTAILHQLLENADAREQHAQALAKRAATDGFKGLQLDYERMPVKLAAPYRDFIARLRRALTSRGLALDVVVEPDRAPLPAANSAPITIMAYNQYGPHSQAGPRATPRFVAAAYGRAATAEGASTLALALGGFKWTPTGAVEQLDWSAVRAAAGPAESWQRGMLTAVPHVRLSDDSELWFDDPESLTVKWQAGYAAGFRNLMLWRLGGNDKSLFEWLALLKSGRTQTIAGM